MKAANKIAAKTLEHLKTNVKAGMSTKEVDKIGEDFVKSLGAKPSFKGLYGFPSAVCTSVNEVVIHGVPNGYVLRDGDILGVDIGIELDGWYGDSALTFGIGEISADDEKLIECAKSALYFAIDIIRDGMRFKELSYELEKFITSNGYVPLRGYCGHGIGRKPHEEPEIPNYLDSKNPNQGPKIKEGMVFCIEPMICQTTGEASVLDDKWSVVPKDGLRTSHYEHTVAIINRRAQVLSVL